MKVRALAVLAFSLAAAAHAIDKNGVAPQAISLPSGPGSIQGLGESFQPQLNTGSGSTAVPIALPRGTGGLAPRLALAYNTGSGNSSLGLGWSLSGRPSIQRNTDRSVPFYTDGPDGRDNDADGQVDNPEELDTFTGIGGEELVQLPDGTFRAENEGAFVRCRRLGAGWEAQARDGSRYLFGQSAGARIEDAGRVFEWCLEGQTDKNQNAIDYEYISDPASAAQRYLHRVRWGQAGAYFAAVFRYEEGRPDVTTSFRAGFELKTSLRLEGIDVISHGVPAPPFALRGDLDGDAQDDALIRRYRLEYDPAAHLSLLTRVTLLGADGVTALPPQTFAYGPWTPPDEAAAFIIRSRDAPQAAFESPSVELIEMNGDGLPDLLTTAGSQHRVFLNRGVDGEGRLAWAPGRPVENAPSIDISSDRTHLADATADGLADLLVKVSNTSFICYDNTSQSAWTTSPFTISNTDTWPIWPHDGASGALSRSFDSDYSRSNDVLHTGASGSQLWLLLPGGRYSRELRFPPLIFDGQTFRFDLPGTHIADLNGDRLQDLAWIQSHCVVYFPNRGRGDFAAAVVLELGRPIVAADIERSNFSDIDGDGLVDLTVVRPSFQPAGVVYWLNRFQKGLEGPRSVGGLPAQSTGDTLRWADMNGNGTTDIVISQAASAPGEKVLVIDLVPEGKRHLLERIENGLGLKTTMSYESSTEQMVRAESAGDLWSSRMPVDVTVLAKIVEEDGLSPPNVQTFTYRDPYYDPRKQEFRGFARAEAREAGDATVEEKRTRVVFDTGRVEACRKGKLLGQEVLGNQEKLFNRSITTWEQRALGDGVDGRQVCFAFAAAQDEFIYEGEVEAVRLRTETDYDDHGNAVAERRHGVLDAAGDEVFLERAFEIRAEAWQLDLLSRETTRDGAGRRFAERRLVYDDRGNLEREEDWLDVEDRMVPVLRQRFDAFGNVVEKTDARGSRRSMAYDSLLYALAVSETVHLREGDLIMTAEVDLGFGTVTEAIDFSGERSAFTYDPLARLTDLQKPGGAGETYEYQLASPVSLVIQRTREDAQGATFDSYIYSDGRGRPLGSKVEGEVGRWRFVEAKAYNARKLAARSFLPHGSDTPEYAIPEAGLPHEAMTYDAQGRPVETLKADGSRARTEYRPLATAVFDGNDLAGQGGPDLRRVDGLGRQVAVEEQNGVETYVTAYAWNARGELERVTDALRNVKRFRFDSLGRLLEVNDPDRGVRRYTYDDAGNRLSRADAKGRVTTYAHDAANRILTKDHARRIEGGADPIDSAYHYDSPAGSLEFGDGTAGSARNVLGRLAWVEDQAGEEHFSYDERGNLEWVLRRFRDPDTGLLIPYRIERSHDLMDREAAVTFPDNDRLVFHHGAGSFVERIDGGPGGGVILAEADYAASGQPLRLRFGNGTESLYEYDASQRLVRLQTLDAGGAEVLHQTLAYDQAFNITSIDDERPAAAAPLDSPRRATARFVYDELKRLTQARYGADGMGGQIDYTHDAIGNLLEQTTPEAGAPGHLDDPAANLGSLTYAGGREGRDGRAAGDPPGPHAVTATAGGHRLEYDADGNLTVLDGAVLDWDYEDQIEAYRKPGVAARYLHDHADRRLAKHVDQGRARSRIIYLDKSFEVTNGSPAKYALLNGKRLARIQGMLDPGRERLQRLALASGWNLIAAAVATPRSLREVFGADAAVYEARGGSYAAVEAAAAVPAGKALWVYAPSARLAVLRGAALVAPPPEPSPPPLHAWPHLAPFRPQAHLQAEAPLHVHDAATRRWLRRAPNLPAFLSDAPPELGAAQAFWSPDAVFLAPGNSDPQVILHYHPDSVGSTAALTDAEGRLVEERTHYPYGGLRHTHQPGTASGGQDYDFTGKERDRESGLIAMGARGYLDFLGGFLSPDPRFAEAARLAAGSKSDQTSFATFLTNPQMGNLYAYGLRNPLKFVDPDGLDARVAAELWRESYFVEALDKTLRSEEGRYIFNRIQQKGYTVTVEKGDLTEHAKSQGRNYVAGATWSTDSSKTIRIVLDVDNARKFRGESDLAKKAFAKTIHHEFLHALIYRFIDVERRLAAQALVEGRMDDFAQHAALAKYGNELHQRLDRGENESELKFKQQVGLPAGDVEFGKIDLSDITVTPIKPE